MKVCVVDASAMAFAVAAKGGEAAAMRARLTALEAHAPHLIDAEVGNVLRRAERRGDLDAAEAEQALTTAQVLVDQRHAHAGPLGHLAWRWQHNLSFYDALYVALAASLGVPLLTADERLARSARLGCEVALV